MANPNHLSLLTRSVADWNQWRTDNTDIQPDLIMGNLCQASLRKANLAGANLAAANLAKADLRKANLSGAEPFMANLQGANLDRANLDGAMLDNSDLSMATLRGASLYKATLWGAHLCGADLREADLVTAYLYMANLSGANLRKARLITANLVCANLSGADLREADLREADLRGADLTGANLAGAYLERAALVNTTCNKAILTGCRIYGISAWDVQLEEAQQANLIITPEEEPDITVDNLEVAQFIYLLLNNQRIRHVIDTITSKVVLILGRFTPERKVVLDAIRDQLRQEDYLPVLFDFQKPRGQTTLGTIDTLASMARFVIADITDAKSVLQELTMIVPHRPFLPVQPILLSSQQEPGMFDFFRAYPWFLETLQYREQKELLESLRVKVILPAEQKAKELIATQRK